MLLFARLALTARGMRYVGEAAGRRTFGIATPCNNAVLIITWASALRRVARGGASRSSEPGSISTHVRTRGVCVTFQHEPSPATRARRSRHQALGGPRALLRLHPGRRGQEGVRRGRDTGVTGLEHSAESQQGGCDGHGERCRLRGSRAHPWVDIARDLVEEQQRHDTSEGEGEEGGDASRKRLHRGAGGADIRA